MKPKVAISLGDPKGIGPEVASRTLGQASLAGLADPVIFGDKALLRPPFVARCTEPEAAIQAAASLKAAVDALLAGDVDALVTAPLHKAALLSIQGGPFMGHTGYLAYRCEGTPLMCFVADQLRVGLLTVHVPVGDVPRLLQQIGPRGIARRVGIFAEGVARDLGVDQPRLALLGLNPHAGEEGLLGSEETRLLAPAVEEAQQQGVQVEGPFSADGYFGRVARSGPQHDAVLACYHDQGLVGFKALVPNRGAQVTFGLPIVRTSCLHGTARDIAGSEQASSSSMETAFELATRIAARRRAVA